MRYSAAIGVSLVYFSAFFQSNVAADPKLGDMEVHTIGVTLPYLLAILGYVPNFFHALSWGFPPCSLPNFGP